MVWGKQWSYFPAELKAELDAYFVRMKSPVPLLSDRDDLRPQKAVTVEGKYRSVRVAACALHYDGVNVKIIADLRAICVPERIARIVEHLVKRHGSLNTNVNHVACDLMSIARTAEFLSDDELKVLARLDGKIRARYAEFRKGRVDSDHEIIARLDDPAVCDALLSLPTRTVRDVARSKRQNSLSSANKIQCALILEIWLCTPLRSRNMRELRLDQICKLKFNGKERLAIRIDGHETKTGEAIDAFLSDDAARLLGEYLHNWRPIIIEARNAGDTNLMFPGKNGRVKDHSGFRSLMKKYIENGAGIPFHPHLIRKIVPKIVLDIDPSAMEILRRAGGWKSLAMLHRVYGPRVHRASQEKYLNLMEGRRLTALSGLKDRKHVRG